MADGNLTQQEFWALSEEERCKRYQDLSDQDKFGVRQGMDTGVVSLPCNECKHYYGYARCAAFPDGLTGDHIQAVIEDILTDCGNGFRFERK